MGGAANWNPDPSTLKPVAPAWNPDPSTLKSIDGSDNSEQTEVPPTHWLAATGKTLSDLAQGPGEGLLQTVGSVSRVLNKIPVIGETLAPKQGVEALRKIATPDNSTQAIGAGAEQAAEMLMLPGGQGTLARMGIGALTGATSVAAHEGGTTQGVNPSDVMAGGAVGGLAPAAEGMIKGALNSKLARGMVNESMMATPRDVLYGNPAKAILNEGIATPMTGDLEKFKDAIRSGATLQGASEAAGGRIAAVNGKINELGPQLQSKLVASTKKIPANIVTDPIDQGIQAIMNNRGITKADADAAVAELNAIKQTALKVPAVPGAVTTSWAPLEANTVKQEIGQQINWEGRERVGQLVEPIKRQVYGAMKEAVNSAAPGSAILNERLTNLYAAQSDINKLAGFEEVGRGRSMGGVIGPSWMGRIQALAGRIIPAASWLTPSIGKTIRSAAIPAISAISQQGDQSQ